MSAIVALWNTAPGPPVEPTLQAMIQTLTHANPDPNPAPNPVPNPVPSGGQPLPDSNIGITTAPAAGAAAGIGLARAMSPRVPEDAFDRQPLWSADRTACLVADVRLDEPRALAETLGIEHSSQLPDSALLLAAWQRWGADCVHHLLGSFAFAVWIPSRQQLFAARDHTGECPLFFHRTDRLFALASMPRALRVLPGVGQRLDETWIADWLVSSLPEGRTTIFAGIERLLPGHRLTASPAGVRVERYWSPFDAPPIRFQHNAEYAEGLLEVLDRATASRLRRIGGLACQLSSGLDSSSVLASAATLLSRTGEPIRAYTSVPQPGFSGQSYSPRPVIDEGPFAAEAAALYPNVTHVPFITEGIPLLPTLQSFSDALDEPFLNGVNALWITGIARDARRHGIHTVLQGSAGNATLSYESLTVAARWLRSGQWHLVLRHLRTLRRNGEMSYRNAARAIFELALPDFINHPRWRREGVVFDRGESLIHPRFAATQRLAERALGKRLLTGTGYIADRLNLYGRADFGRINFATRVLTGVDPRDPTNDARIWNYTCAIPPGQFAIDGHSRSLVRRALRGRLPDATLDRYRQGRQGADWYLTMQTNLPQLQHEMSLIARCEPATRMLDVARMQWLLDNFPTSGYGTIHTMNTWKYSLLRAISLGNFLRRHQ